MTKASERFRGRESELWLGPRTQPASHAQLTKHRRDSQAGTHMESLYAQVHVCVCDKHQTDSQPHTYIHTYTHTHTGRQREARGLQVYRVLSVRASPATSPATSCEHQQTASINAYRRIADAAAALFVVAAPVAVPLPSPPPPPSPPASPTRPRPAPPASVPRQPAQPFISRQPAHPCSSSCGPAGAMR